MIIASDIPYVKLNDNNDELKFEINSNCLILYFLTHSNYQSCTNHLHTFVQNSYHSALNIVHLCSFNQINKIYFR